MCIDQVILAEELKFLQKLDLEELCEFADITDYLDLKYISEVICAFLASSFRGKHANLIKAEWDIEKDLDEDTMDEIKEKFAWVDEIFPISK